MLILLAVLLAAVPEKGEGTITLLGGVRTIFPTNSDYLSAQPGASHQPLQPGGIASFGYQYDEDLHFKIELGYLFDRYKIPGGDLTIKSIPMLLAMDFALWRSPRLTLYGGGGLGYSLNTGSRGGLSNEANSTAAYVGIGLRVQLSGPVALVVEDRWTLANTQADPDPALPRLNVGGNLFSLGLMFHFLEPDEHPTMPH